MKKIYLAGPDVFLANAIEVLQKKKNLCKEFGYEGLSPFDNEVNFSEFSSKGAAAFEIARLNEEMIRGADAIVANLVPFRGPGADQGTVYELGFAAALGKKCFGYSSHWATLYERVCHHYDLDEVTEPTRDTNGMTIENFGLNENLMIQKALHEGKTFGSLVEALTEIKERGLL